MIYYIGCFQRCDQGLYLVANRYMIGRIGHICFPTVVLKANYHRINRWIILFRNYFLSPDENHCLFQVLSGKLKGESFI